jgi:hypothetical protein
MIETGFTAIEQGWLIKLLPPRDAAHCKFSRHFSFHNSEAKPVAKFPPVQRARHDKYLSETTLQHHCHRA